MKLIKNVLDEKHKGKPEPITDDWLRFIVDHAIVKFAPAERNKDEVKKYIMVIVKAHATGDE